MTGLRYTLVCDGSSNQVLIPIIEWLLHSLLPDWAIQGDWADFRHLPHPPQGLANRIRRGLDLYDCDLLFIHRDAEGAQVDQRVNEISGAVDKASRCRRLPPVIPIVPVRMQEAWLMLDEQALREAAGNPRGGAKLDMPQVDRIEDLPDAKDTLFALLRLASGHQGRRLRKLRVRAAAHRLANLISDFDPLRQLPAFRAFEEHTRQVLRDQHWL